MSPSATERWEVVRAGPPSAPDGQQPEPSGWERWTEERFVLPKRWEVEFRHPEVPYDVTLTVTVERRRLSCENVTVSRRPGGPAVGSKALRVPPVASLLIRSAWAVSQAQDAAEDDEEVMLARMRERPPGWLVEDIVERAETIARLPEAARLQVLGHAEDIAHLPAAVRARLEMVDPGDYVDPVPPGAVKVMRELAKPDTRKRASNHDALVSIVADSYRKLYGDHADPAPAVAIAAREIKKTLRYGESYLIKLLYEGQRKGLLGIAKRSRASDHAELLRQVVDLYRGLVAPPDPDRRPAAAIAAELGYLPSYVKKLLNEARREGILGPAMLGRAGERPPLDLKARGSAGS